MVQTSVQKKAEWVHKPVSNAYNLQDYNKACQTFDWKDVEKEFDWYQTGKVNIVHEMIDRHTNSPLRHKVALFFWDPDRGTEEKYTFLELKDASSKFANILKKYQLQKGDRVALFLPRSPELYIAFLGILRLGAIPVPLFEAFMEDAVLDRLSDSGAKALLTSKTFLDRIPFAQLPDLQHVFLADHTETPLEYNFYFEMETAQKECEPTWLSLEDPLVIHYTSGSTGKSKGVLHKQYAMVGHRQTALWSLDLKQDDLYWCTADPGWVTGTSYGIFGPWLLGTSSLVVGGRFSSHRWYEALEKFHVSVWYSAPTAFRLLMKEGVEIAKNYDFSALRHICSVGEPLNPEALVWIRHLTGLAPHETWWMTETGMHLVCNFPCVSFPIGATGKPFPGTYSTVINEDGDEVPPNTLGLLVVKPPWPAMMQTIWNHPEKYASYFHAKGWYISGDMAYKDEAGFIWFAGRVDDVIKTQGERVGPFEVESALLEHMAVAEAGVIGKPDELRGQIIKAYISLRPGFSPNDGLKEEIIQFVKHHLAPFAAPKELEFCDKVPKTRSGKIMRRVLRAWDRGEDPGDLSTMEES